MSFLYIRTRCFLCGLSRRAIHQDQSAYCRSAYARKTEICPNLSPDRASDERHPIVARPIYNIGCAILMSMDSPRPAKELCRGSPTGGTFSDPKGSTRIRYNGSTLFGDSLCPCVIIVAGFYLHAVRIRLLLESPFLSARFRNQAKIQGCARSDPVDKRCRMQKMARCCIWSEIQVNRKADAFSISAIDPTLLLVPPSGSPVLSDQTCPFHTDLELRRCRYLSTECLRILYILGLGKPPVEVTIEQAKRPPAALRTSVWRSCPCMLCPKRARKHCLSDPYHRRGRRDSNLTLLGWSMLHPLTGIVSARQYNNISNLI